MSGLVLNQFIHYLSGQHGSEGFTFEAKISFSLSPADFSPAVSEICVAKSKLQTLSRHLLSLCASVPLYAEKNCMSYVTTRDTSCTVNVQDYRTPWVGMLGHPACFHPVIELATTYTQILFSILLTAGDTNAVLQSLTTIYDLRHTPIRFYPSPIIHNLSAT
ncbi:hypothetical protein B0H12DRAFT_1068197 [Mycena haematopus]|nr:hypothetical protein B0H12DRAFT_1068197 [Mycena haematopus]